MKKEEKCDSNKENSITFARHKRQFILRFLDSDSEGRSGDLKVFHVLEKDTSSNEFFIVEKLPLLWSVCDV